MAYHLSALITILPDVPAPKRIGVSSGYAPHHKFKGVDYLVSGHHLYDDDELHFPGESFMAKISFASWEFFGSNVKIGDVFEIKELDRLVGTGVVKTIAQPRNRGQTTID